MLLAPSDIHFIKDCATNGLSLTVADQNLISSVSNEICGNNAKSFPKIQVSEKGGAYFALNNSSLHVYRELEKKGKCVRIQVDVVALTKVPEHVQKGMIVTKNDHVSGPNNVQHISNGAEGRSTYSESGDDSKKGYQKVSADGIVPGDIHQHLTGLDINRDSIATDGGGSVGDESDTTSSYSPSEYSDPDDLTDTECDEDLTCNVCDRSFDSTRQLAFHQQKKRHFGCSVCDSVFPSLMRLESHKESLDHWSEDEGLTHDSESDDETDEEAGDGKVEELERLL